MVVPLGRAEPWTEAELDELDDAYRYELVDGRLLVSPRPVPAHARTAYLIARALSEVVGDHLEVLMEVMVTLPTSSRSPDVLVVRRDEVAGDAPSLLPGVVELAVEVLSSSSVGDDRIRKPAEYAAAGIPAYWYAEPGDPPLVTAFALDAGAAVYRRVSGPASTVAGAFAVDLTGRR